MFSFLLRGVRVLRLNRGKMLTTVFTKSQTDLGFYSKYQACKENKIKSVLLVIFRLFIVFTYLMKVLLCLLIDILETAM